jgi:hypothetical protein
MSGTSKYNENCTEASCGCLSRGTLQIHVLPDGSNRGICNVGRCCKCHGQTGGLGWWYEDDDKSFRMSLQPGDSTDGAKKLQVSCGVWTRGRVSEGYITTCSVISLSTAIGLRKYRIPSDLRSQAEHRLVSTTVGDHAGILGAVVFAFCSNPRDFVFNNGRRKEVVAGCLQVCWAAGMQA